MELIFVCERKKKLNENKSFYDILRANSKNSSAATNTYIFLIFF